MKQLAQFFLNPMALLIVAILLLIVALWLFFRRVAERERSVTDRLTGVEQSLSEQMARNSAQSGEQASRSREELSSNLRGMGDSVTRVMSEMARTQQAQLDQFAGQIRDMGRLDEERMSDMRKTVEERLGAYEERMDRIGNVLDDKLDRNEQRLERMRQTVEQQMDSLREGNNLRLEQMQRSVDEKLNTTLEKRLNESFRAVSERLDQVYRGLGEMQTLASGVGDLKKVLTGVKARGLLGEIQLGSLLAQVLSADQYVENLVLRKGGEAVDYAILLPGGAQGGEGCYLPIDARFPHEAYYRLLDAQEGADPDLAEQMSQELAQKLLVAADRITEEFIVPPHTTDFAVLFLASEGLYAEALRRPELVEVLQREHHVMLTGPSTLAALLNSLQMGFRTLAIEKRSEEVWALLGAVRGEFANFAEALTRTQKRIRQAGESIEDASRKSRAIQRKLKGVDKLSPAEQRTMLNEDDESDGLYDDSDWD